VSTAKYTETAISLNHRYLNVFTKSCGQPYKDAYSLQWNFGVQYQVSSESLLEADYVGSGNRRLDIGGSYTQSELQIAPLHR
jgi:hypothetical protein